MRLAAVRLPARLQSPFPQTTVQIRRPLESVVLDDDSRFLLDRDCVVGRDPSHCDTPLNGLRPIRIDVRANGMSRAHLEIRRLDGRVFIIDRQSRNGVAIRPAGQTQWIPIAPGKPIVWLPGMSVRIGSRILRLEAAGQRPALRNDPAIPIAVRTAKPAKPAPNAADIDRTVRIAAAAAPPSSASTVRIDRRRAAPRHPAIFAIVRPTASAAPRKPGRVATTSERNAT